MMMASQIDRTGNQEHLGHRARTSKPKVQLVGDAPCARQLGQPPHQLLWVPDHTVRTFVEQVDVVSGVKCYAGGGGRCPWSHAASTTSAACRLEPRRLRLRDTRTHHAPALAPSRRHRRRHRGRFLPASRSLHPRRRGRDPTTHTRGAGPGSASSSIPARCACEVPELTVGDADVDADGDGDGDAPLHLALHTELCERIGVRYPLVQTGMGWVAGPRLVAATSEAGGLGILASATMSLDELAAAIAEVRRRTTAPFGVNLRTDVADVHERIELMIETGARVASFAQAPNAALVTRCKEAGLFVIPTVGARRHAEKVAEWGGVDTPSSPRAARGRAYRHRAHDAPAPPGRRRGRRPRPRPGGGWLLQRAGLASWPPLITARPASPWGPASCSRPRAGCPIPSRRCISALRSPAPS